MSAVPEARMMILLAALSALGATQESEAQDLARVESSRSPVRLWMSNDRRYREGDRVRIQVDADTDGFLLVLNYDPTGRLRVLFPLDPRDDTRIEAGRRYEVRSEGANAAFRAGGDGAGFVYTAVAEEPWRFDEIVLADRWDLTRLELDARADDPEPEITELVQRLAGPRGFDYDVMGYRVYGEVTHTSYNTYVYPAGPTYVYDDYLFCNNWNWRYDGCRRWPYDNYWSFSLGYYRPYHYGYYGYYSPYRYGYGYDRYRYGYGYPYFPSRPSYFPVGKAPVLVGRPRGYTVVPRGTLASGFRGSRGGIGSAVTGPSRGSRGDALVPDSRGRARGPARPAREVVGRGGPTITSSSPEPSRAAPPARRSRGSESRYSVPDRGSNRSEPARGADRSEPGRGFSRPERVAPSEREAPRARGESSRYTPPARGEDRVESGRGFSRPERAAPSERETPRARGESSRREPPQRFEPSRREAPAVRRDPPAARRDPPAQRAEPVRREPPSRSRAAEPRRDPPRAQAHGGGDRGGQGGAQRGGGGGGGGGG